MAARLKESAGGEITVLSAGDDSVKNSLKNCLAVGADYAYLAKDDNYQNRDPQSIAGILKAAKSEIEAKTGKKFDVIFCGKEATDFTSGQAGIMLAAELGVPVVADAVDISTEDEDASIFDIADVGIVGDVNQILPVMIEEIRKRKN